MTQTYGTRQSEFSYLGPIGQAEIIAINHAEALMMDQARGMAVVTVTTSGLRITRDMLDTEIRATRAPRSATYSGPMPLVVGLNASANMLA
jgi:hypothetical protein